MRNGKQMAVRLARARVYLKYLLADEAPREALRKLSFVFGDEAVERKENPGDRPITSDVGEG